MKRHGKAGVQWRLFVCAIMGFVRLAGAQAPTADFDGDPLIGFSPVNVQFEDQSTGFIMGRLWTFGDGLTSSDQHPLHSYTDPGVYHVSLTVGNMSGNDTAIKPAFVRVDQPGSNTWAGGWLEWVGNTGPYSSLALDPDGGPAIAYCHGILGIGSNSVKYTYFDGTNWNMEVIDDDTDAGPHISLAFDSTGTAHVAYYDAKDKALNYAVRGSGGIWRLERVDNDPDNVGQYPSIAIDAEDRPHISYYDADDGDALYAVFNGIAWILTNIEWMDDVGQYSSLVLDSNDMPRVCYYNATDNALRIAAYDDRLGFWLYDTVDDSADVGKYCRMGIAGGAIPGICYYDADNGNLKYATWVPGSNFWVTTTVDAGGNVGEYCDLALDSAGDPHISYYDRTNGDLKYAAFNRTLTNWSIEVAEDFQDAGQHSSLAVGDDGSIHACYYDADNDGLLYARAVSTSPPMAQFTAYPTNGLAPLTVQFASLASGTVTAREWFFGDGGTSTEESPSHTYSTPGTYTVEYQVENDHGFDTEEKTGFITALDPTLTAAFTHAPATGVVSLTVDFTDTSTGPVAGRLWAFGDGETSTNAAPSHKYTVPGMYSVSLTVTNAVDTDTVTVSNAVTALEHIDAGFTRGPTSGTVPLMVAFTNTSTGPYTHSLWSFGDGQTSILAAPSHSYTTAGTYTVSLTVSNAFEADVVTLSNAVTALEPVDAAFGAAPTQGVVSLTVQFTNESTGPYTHSLWSFGTGQSSTDTHPEYAYTTAGVYTVSLTVSNSYDVDTQVLTDGVSVLEHIVPAFSGGPLVGETPSLVTFTDATTGPVTDWAWRFGDGGTSALSSPSHTYTTSGVFTVALEASNTYETQSMARTNYVTVLDPPAAAFSATPRRGPRPLSVEFTDQSNGNVSHWLWDFGDGHTSTDQNPSHDYADIGRFSVSLTVSNVLASDVHTETDLVLTYDETYVSPFGSHSWPFHTWATAANDIQSAISAQTYGGTVWVSNGTYNTGSIVIYGAMHNRVALTNSVRLLSVNGPAATVIEGQPRDWESTPRAIRGAYVGSGAVLSGFTIRSGGTLNDGDDIHEQSGGGAWCQPDGVISNCTMTENTSEDYGGGVYGGHVYDSELHGNGSSEVKWGGAAARATLVDCQVYSNSGYWGGAVYGGTNLRCVVRDNVGVHGGAAYASHSIDCEIADNESYEGGGTWQGRLENCLVVHNLSKESGGAYGMGGGCYQSELVNCTVADNEAQTYGGGMYEGSAENAILYFNTAVSGGANVSGGALQYSCTTPSAAGTGNIVDDPAFADRASRDYHLTTNSLCIDNGNDSGLTHDLDQFLRPRDGDDNGSALYDMGAYEFWADAQQLVAAEFTADVRQPRTGQSVQFTDESTGPIVSWSWTFGDGGTSSDQNPSHVYATEGVYTVALTVDGVTHSDTETKLNYISVRDPIVVDFTGTPNSTDATALTVQFTNLTTGEVDGWLWDFGDFATSTEENPSHHYHTNGSYTVTLTASNVIESVSLTRDEYINVATPMAADFQTDRTNGTAPLTVQFSTHATGPLRYWSWDFGDGSTAAIANPSHAYVNPGIYTVTHVASNDYRFTSVTKTNLIEVFGPVSAGFAANHTEGFAPLGVQFTDESTGPVSHWLWAFGDGQTGTSADPLHVYNAPGYCTVTLTVSNTFESSTLTKTNFITVQRDPLIAAFSGQPLVGSPPLGVQFANESAGPYTASTWSFGDGGNSTQEHPLHTYNDVGTYTVSLTVSNAYDVSATSRTDYVVVQQKLGAWFTVAPMTGAVPLTVQFTDQSTGTMTHWSWDLGDGTTDTTQNPSHTYTTTGTYSVSLVISNATDSDTVTRSRVVTVGDRVDAAFSGTPRLGPVPLLVTFTNESTGPITGQLWLFGDGVTSAERDPTHTYTNPGTYTVSLTVSNAFDSDTQGEAGYVTTRAALQARFTVDHPAGDPPHTVTFADQSVGLVDGWLWSFGDGGISTAASPSHTYTNPGNYTVSLTVTNLQETDTLARTDYINVETLDPDFTGDPRSGAFPLAVQFTNTTAGTTIWQEWTFGDGTGSAIQHPSHTYRRRGRFDVALTVSNALFSRTEQKSGYINTYESLTPGWQFETIDTTGEVGAFGSLAIDASGRPHIAYRDTSGNALNYATFDGVNWQVATVDADGLFTSLALTTNGLPAISYYCYGDRSLKYASFDGGAWHVETVDDTNDTGVYSSLAFGADGHPRISYYDQNDSALRFARHDGAAWQTETVDNNGFAGLYTSLAIDTNGHPCISYGADSALRYAAFNGATWQIESVPGAGTVGFTSLALDSRSQPVIALYDLSGRDVALASRKDGTWQIEPVDTVPDLGEYCSLALNAIDAPRIAYRDSSNDRLKYAARVREQWQIEVVDAGPNVGEYASLALDPSGRPGISYYDAGLNKDLSFAYNTALPPVDAEMSISPRGGPAPLEVLFSSRTAGPVTYRAWDFGDGQTATGPTSLHTYSNAGPYTVTLTVSNSVSGDAYAVSEYMIVGDLAVDFDASPTNGLTPLTVLFTNLTSGYADAWLWDFGDGQQSAEANPEHTYALPGPYTVQLSATNAFQSNSHARVDFISAVTIAADFSATDRFGPAPLTVAFSNESTGPYTAQTWHFGDGHSSTEPNPTNTYNGDGNYTVSLTVTAPGQAATHTETAYVHVGHVAAGFSAGPLLGPVPLEVLFTNLSTGPVTAYLWDFGDGSQSTNAHPRHVYTNEGTFSVSLRAGNSFESNRVVKSDLVLVLGQRPSAWWIRYVSSGEYGASHPSLALIDDDHPVISFYDWRLAVAMLDGTNFQTEVIDGVFRAGKYGNSVAIKSSGLPGIAYNYDDGTKEYLKYAWHDGSLWHTETASGSWNVGRYASLAFDRNDHPVISYMQEEVGGEPYNLHIARHDGRVWSTELVDPGPAGYWSSLALDGEGRPHIAHGGSIRYAADLGAGWTLDTVAAAAGSTSFTSLGLDPSGQPLISFYDSDGGNLKLARQNGSTWQVETVDHELDVGRNSSLAMDGDLARIAYDHTTDGDVKYAAFDGRRWIFDVVTSSGYDPSLKLDSRGRPCIAYVDGDAVMYAVPARLQAGMALAPRGGSAPLDVQFVDTSAGTVTSRLWDFGDGTTSTALHPNHTYLSNGMYTVTLTLSNWAENSVTTNTAAVHVLDLEAGFSAHQTSGGLPLTVHFSDESRGFEVESWRWDFGDGFTSTNRHPAHTYTNAGSYAVSLTVTNYQESHSFGVPDYIDVAADGWESVVVDARGDSGLYSSLALDGRTPHIAYYDATNHVARYATYNGSTWVLEDVGDTLGLDGHTQLELRPDGLPGMVFRGSDGVGSLYYYGVRSNGSWQVESTHDGGSGPNSLAYAGDGRAYLVYADSSYKLLLKSRPQDGVWTVPQWVDIDASARQVSLLLGDGGPHVSYYDAVIGRYAYAFFAFGDWNKETVDPAAYAVGTGTHGLALRGGIPQVSYHDAPNGTLKYADSSGFGWSNRTLDNSGAVGQYSSLAFDSRRLARIVYYDADNTALKYAVRDDDRWVTVTLDNSGSVGKWCSLALDPLGNPVVSYYDEDLNALRYLASAFEPFGFSASPRYGAPPLDVSFTSRSVAPADNWSWNFGDGGTSTNEHPQHTYTNLGIYTVVLTADVGGIPTAKTNVGCVVVNDLVADFSGGPVGGVTPLTVTFTNASSGTIAGQLWDLGDGTQSTNVHPVHVYSNSGVFTVRLTVSNAYGAAFSTRADYIHTAGPLHPAFSATPPAGVAPVAVQFTDETTGVPETWEWDFGDGMTSTNRHPLHAYANGGVYSVSLTVENAYESVNTTRTDLVTVEDILTADFVADKTSGATPLTVSFSNKVAGPVTVHHWRFGDGSSSFLANPRHTYGAAGNYTVTLIASSALQTDTVTKTNYIEVTDLAANFTASPRVGKPPLLVGFSDQSGGPVSSWHWDFGDGETSGLRNPAHTYADYGRYAVSLTVSGDGKTNTMTKTEYIRVEDLEARFAATPRIGSAPLEVAFTDESTGDVQTRIWDFGDGVTSTDTNPVHTYTLDGDYTVELSVYDSFDTHTLVRANCVKVGDLDMNWTLWDLGDRAASTSLAVDSRDRAHIAYATYWNGGDVKHLVVEGVSWTVQTVDTNTDDVCSLALDAASQPHVAYVRREDGDSTNVLCYAVLDGSNWVSDVVYDTEEHVSYVSLALGSGDSPWLAFGRLSRPLHIASAELGGWQVSSLNLPADDRPALAIQPSGYPAVAHASRPVQYAAYDGAAWQVEQSYLVGDYTPGGSLAFGDDGVPLIASHRRGGTSYYGLGLVRLGEPDWSSEVIDPDPDAGWYSAMAVGPYGNVGVAYMTASNQLKFAVQHGTGWHIETLDEGVDHYDADSLGLDFDSRGCAHISYRCNSQLKYAFNSDVVQARFSASPTSGEAPLAVQFTDQSAGAVASRLWDFGDGQTSAEASPLHTYTADGVYTVSLIVGDGENSDTMTRTNLVSVESFAANFSASPTKGGPGMSVQFMNESTGTVDTFAWDFGDGGTSTDENPTYVYTNAGLYDVSLTVSNAWRSHTLTRDNLIRVHTVFADFSSGVTTGMPPLTVTFTNLSLGHTNAVWWFGDVIGDRDAVESMATAVDHTYRFIGTYTVAVNADGGGEHDRASSNDLVVVSNPDWDLETVLAGVGNAWEKDVRLAQDGDGHELVSYRHDGALWLATHDGAAWATEQVASGVALGHDLVVTGAGVPVVCYSVESSRELMYAYRAAGTWTAVAVEDEVTNPFPSIAVDTAGVPWIAYKAHGFLHVADYQFDGTNWNWHVDMVDPGVLIGPAPRIDVAANGEVGVVYSHFSGVMRYASRVFLNGSWSWSVSTIDAGNVYGGYSSFRFGADGNPHAAYWDRNSKDLKYAVFSGSTWSVTTVDSEGDTGRYCDLTHDASGYPRIAYAIQYDHRDVHWGDGDLKFAWYSGSEWRTEQIDGASYCRRVGTRVLSDGRPAIAYLSPTGLCCAVCNRPVELTANFVASPLGGSPPLSVTFTDRSYGNVLTRLWDFDGTNTSAEISPTHVYTQAGTYTVRLTVADEDGDDAATTTIIVEEVTAGFEASPTVGMVPLEVSFTNTSSASANRWVWDFGDGGQSPLRDPVHTYTTTGTFNVSLIAHSDWASDSNRLAGLVSVTNPPPIFVRNVEATQRTGTKLVDITYDVGYRGTGSVQVAITVSDDGGVTFNVPASSFSGHGYTSGRSVGDHRRTVWNAADDWDMQAQPDMVFRVAATDGALSSDGDSPPTEVNTIITGDPVVQEIDSADCNSRQPIYYLQGVSVEVEFGISIDWNGHVPGEIIWQAGDEEYGGLEESMDFDVGVDFGVGGKLTVVAVSENGVSSDPMTANFDVIDPPIGIPAHTLVVQPGDPLRYHAPSHILSVIDAGKDKIPTDDKGNYLYGFTGTPMKLSTDVSAKMTVYGDGTARLYSFSLYGNYTQIGKIAFEPKVFGAIRLDYDPKSATWLPKGNLGFDVKAQVDTPAYYPWPGIYAKGRYDLTGGANFQLTDWISPSEPVFNGEFPVVAGFELIGGAGLDFAWALEAYVRAEGFVTAQYPMDPHLKKLGIALKTGGRFVGILGYEKKLTELKTQWYFVGGPTPRNARAVSRDVPRDGSGVRLLCRAYAAAANHDRFAAGGRGYARTGLRALSCGSQTATPDLLVENVYPLAAPSLAAGATNRTLLWLHDNTSRLAENRTELMGSDWNGASWGLPNVVWDDGTPDFMARVVVLSNGVTVAAWANGADTLPSGASRGDCMTNLEIAVATRTPGGDAWIPLNLTTNDVLDHSPLLDGPDAGPLLLTWTRNTHTNLLGSVAEPNTLFFSMWDGAGWTPPASAVTGMGMMTWSDLAFDGSNGVFVAAVDPDEDQETRDDVELYATAYDGAAWGAWTRLTDDGVGDTSPKVTYDSEGHLLLAWSRDGVLVTSDSLNLQSPVTVVDAGTNSPVKEIELTAGPGGQVTVLWSGNPADGSRAEPLMAHLDAATRLWSTPIRLLQNDKLERQFTGAYADSNELLLAYGGVDLFTNDLGGVTFGDTDLMVLSHPLGLDLALCEAGLSSLPENPVPGHMATLSAQIHNAGELAATAVTVRFFEGDPTAGGVQIGGDQAIASLRAGTNTTVSVSWPVPLYATPAIYVVVDPDGVAPDRDRANNSVSREYLRPDLTSFGVSVERSAPDRRIAHASVVNVGTAAALSPVRVRYTRGSTNGPVLASIPISVLSTGQHHDASFEWDLSGETFTSAYEHVYVAVDMPDVVAELDESNNLTTYRIVTTLDSDGDGLFDGDEERLGTHPNLADSDGDGLSDYAESALLGTNPLKADSDGDGMKDGNELVAGTSPLDTSSVLHLSLTWRDDLDAFVLSWPSVSNRVYILRQGRDLLTPLSTGATLSASPPVNLHTNAPGGERHGYYRIEVRAE